MPLIGSSRRLYTLYRRQLLLTALEQMPEGASRTAIHKALQDGYPRLPLSFRSTCRDLAALLDQGLVRKTGFTQATRYLAVPVHHSCVQSPSRLGSDTSVALTQMRDCFGDGVVVAIDATTFGINAPGLHKPITLLPSPDGAMPDLTPFVGKVLSYTGILEVVAGNQEDLRLQIIELHEPAVDTAASPVWAVISGNLGKAPEVNPKGDRISASIAYADGAWLRIAAYPYYSCSDTLKQMEAGSAITAFGAMETYTYKDGDRLQLALRGFGQHDFGGSRKPKVVFSAANPSAGSSMPTDAFTAAS
jgi:hypothetical protein